MQERFTNRHKHCIVITLPDGQVELPLESKLVLRGVDDDGPAPGSQLRVRDGAGCVNSVQALLLLPGPSSTYHDDTWSRLSGWESIGEHS